MHDVTEDTLLTLELRIKSGMASADELLGLVEWVRIQLAWADDEDEGEVLQ